MVTPAAAQQDTRRGEQSPVVVGVDGSTSSDDAIRWAAAEAAARGRPLRIVHAFLWPLLHVPLGPAPGAPADGGFRAQAQRVLSEAEADARSVAPELVVSTCLVVAEPAAALVEQSETAELVVVGSRGLGGFLGLLIGSVGVEVAARSRCPVVVVRPGGQPRGTAGRLVVGADGSEISALAMEFAFQAAARHGRGVRVVHAWSVPVPTGVPGELAAMGYDLDAVEEEHQRLLEEAVSGARAAFPDVDVETRLVCAHPGAALLDAAQDAELLVVGSRGLGGFRGMLLGSVSQAVLHHVQCPVAVVHPPHAG